MCSVTSNSTKDIYYKILNVCLTILWTASVLRLIKCFLDKVSIYLFKVNHENPRAICETYSELTIITPQRPKGRRSGVFIVNFEQVLHIDLVFSFRDENLGMNLNYKLANSLPYHHSHSNLIHKVKNVIRLPYKCWDVLPCDIQNHIHPMIKSEFREIMRYNKFLLF